MIPLLEREMREGWEMENGGWGWKMGDFVLRTTSVSPLDRDKDEVLDPEKCGCIFPYFF